MYINNSITKEYLIKYISRDFIISVYICKSVKNSKGNRSLNDIESESCASLKFDFYFWFR